MKISFKNFIELEVRHPSTGRNILIKDLLLDENEKDEDGWYRITKVTLRGASAPIILKVNGITVNYLWYIDANNIGVRQCDFSGSARDTFEINENCDWELWLYRGYDQII